MLANWLHNLGNKDSRKSMYCGYGSLVSGFVADSGGAWKWK